MKTRPQAKIAVSVVFALFCLLYPALMFGFDVEIDVAPNVLNTESASEVVTVHTDIAFSDVVGSSVFLNGVEIDYWKSDDRGYFVAKFLADEIKGLGDLDIGGYNTLTLTGYTTADEAFIGTQDIKVISVFPKGK